jgi:hypothetical protein
VFTPTTISLSQCYRQKCKVSLLIFAKDAQNDSKLHSYEDNAKVHCAFLGTALSYAMHFPENGE